MGFNISTLERVRDLLADVTIQQEPVTLDRDLLSEVPLQQEPVTPDRDLLADVTL